MTETNIVKKNVKYTDFELAIIRARIGTFESESRARLGTLGKTSRALELGHCEMSRAFELGRSETADRALE